VIMPHKSHQVGLDIDFYLFSTVGDPHDMVDTGKGVTGVFEFEGSWWLLGYLARHHAVDRFFVAPEIKVALCEKRDEFRDWKGKERVILRRIRAWFGHRDHAHMRLLCPRGEPLCFSRAKEIPSGDGCAEARTWLKDPTHVERRVRSEYKPGGFSLRCWKEDPEASYTVPVEKEPAETEAPTEKPSGEY